MYNCSCEFSAGFYVTTEDLHLSEESEPNYEFVEPDVKSVASFGLLLWSAIN